MHDLAQWRMQVATQKLVALAHPGDRLPRSSATTPKPHFSSVQKNVRYGAGHVASFEQPKPVARPAGLLPDAERTADHHQLADVVRRVVSHQQDGPEKRLVVVAGRNLRRQIGNLTREPL